MSSRHSWEQLEDKYHHRCRKCGVRRLRRPDPYGPAWFFDFTYPDGTIKTLERTPPCEEPRP